MQLILSIMLIVVFFTLGLAATLKLGSNNSEYRRNRLGCKR